MDEHIPGTLKPDEIRRYYRGAAWERVRDVAIPALEAAEAAGCWQKGDSRPTHAALNKTSRREIKLAIVGAKACAGDSIAVEYGQVLRADLMLVHARGALERSNASPDASHLPILEYARWCEAFAPIATLVKRLDATRPKPEFVVGEISPTIWRNAAGQMGLDFSSVRVPDMRWRKIEVKDERGRPEFHWFLEILWPKATLHNKSRFAWGSKAGNDQCHACGHAIKNPRNWVPLLADSSAGLVSLWVGRDCAEKFFGIVASGEADNLKAVKAEHEPVTGKETK
jgi:hypothetical protein